MPSAAVTSSLGKHSNIVSPGLLLSRLPMTCRTVSKLSRDVVEWNTGRNRMPSVANVVRVNIK